MIDRNSHLRIAAVQEEIRRAGSRLWWARATCWAAAMILVGFLVTWRLLCVSVVAPGAFSQASQEAFAFLGLAATGAWGAVLPAVVACRAFRRLRLRRRL